MALLPTKTQNLLPPSESIDIEQLPDNNVNEAREFHSENQLFHGQQVISQITVPRLTINITIPALQRRWCLRLRKSNGSTRLVRSRMKTV